VNYLPGLALNPKPLDLCLLSSWDYRCESPAPGPKISRDAMINFSHLGVHLCGLM
jgi:hypothetical protein